MLNAVQFLEQMAWDVGEIEIAALDAKIIDVEINRRKHNSSSTIEEEAREGILPILPEKRVPANIQTTPSGTSERKIVTTE